MTGVAANKVKEKKESISGIIHHPSTSYKK